MYTHMDLNVFPWAQYLDGSSLLKLVNCLSNWDTCTGRPKPSNVKANIDAVKAPVEEDRQASMKDLTTVLVN